MNFQDTLCMTIIPTKVVGPLKISYFGCSILVNVPLATFETPVWYSVKRGALVSQKTDGITVSVIEDCMTRSSILEGNNLSDALMCKEWIESHFMEIAEAVESTSHFAKLLDIKVENVGRLLYVRLSIFSGNASGHNMVTAAMDIVLSCILSACPSMRYVSISGNYCTDKKASAINGILGRGKRVSAEIMVPRNVCLSVLKASPEQIVDLNVKKNLIGSVLSGGVRTANAHFANVLLAMYLSTGQDGANIVESSQGITFADMQGKDLYFSVNLPNIIVGTVGNGKDLEFARSNLQLLQCDPADDDSAKKLAAIIASAVLCSELSLMAAQVNQGELMSSHVSLERNKK